MKIHVTVPINFLGSYKNSTRYIRDSYLYTTHISIVSYTKKEAIKFLLKYGCSWFVRRNWKHYENTHQQSLLLNVHKRLTKRSENAICKSDAQISLVTPKIPSILKNSRHMSDSSHSDINQVTKFIPCIDSVQMVPQAGIGRSEIG
jgi:hypothetical protein